MPNKVEGKYSGEFIASQAPGQKSFSTVTLKQNSTIYQPGDVLGVILATGKATNVVPAATDGSEVASLINYARVDATAGDVAAAAVFARDGEVNGSEINYNTVVSGEILAIKSQLADVGIIVRTGV